MVAVALIGLFLGSIFLIGLLAYIIMPPNYNLYTSGHVQNVTSSDTRNSLEFINDMVRLSPILMMGVSFIAGIAVMVRARQGGLFG